MLILWIVFAVVLDIFIDPAWVSFNYSIYGAGYFLAWSVPTQFAYLHLIPFAISNAIEGIGAGLLAPL